MCITYNQVAFHWFGVILVTNVCNRYADYIMQLLILLLAWQQVRLFGGCGDVGSGLIHCSSELYTKKEGLLRGKADLLLMGKVGTFLRETALLREVINPNPS